MRGGRRRPRRNCRSWRSIREYGGYADGHRPGRSGGGVCQILRLLPACRVYCQRRTANPELRQLAAGMPADGRGADSSAGGIATGCALRRDEFESRDRQTEQPKPMIAMDEIKNC